MKVTKDNLYEKMEELRCANCGLGGPEYFFAKEESPLCESCVFEIHKFNLITNRMIRDDIRGVE